MKGYEGHQAGQQSQALTSQKVIPYNAQMFFQFSTCSASIGMLVCELFGGEKKKHIDGLGKTHGFRLLEYKISHSSFPISVMCCFTLHA